MIKFNYNFDNWSIPTMDDLKTLCPGSYYTHSDYINNLMDIPILQYSDFPHYIDGYDRNSALDRFQRRFTLYYRDGPDVKPLEKRAWAFPVPPYPEVEYPYFPQELLPEYYRKSIDSGTIVLPKNHAQMLDFCFNVSEIAKKTGKYLVYFNVVG